MQPYFLPYIGYFQLMAAVDKFVVYDDIEYTKKGWINRNRILLNGGDTFITLPLRKDSDYADVRERYLADSWPLERKKLLQRVAALYRKAPYFDQAFALFERSVSSEERNLFSFILASLIEVRDYLGIETPMVVSSTLGIDRGLKAQARVLATCKRIGCGTYVNPIGGLELYSSTDFAAEGIQLRFLRSTPHQYPQLGGDFVPWLSILDVVMFNSKAECTRLLKESYELR